MKDSNTFRFREFPIYKDSLKFISEVKDYTKKHFPKSELYGLTSQLWRSLDSIVLNIAEGTDKYSSTDFSRFLNQALGSLNETVACFDIALENRYISLGKHDEFLLKADNLYRQLKAFSSYVRRSKRSS
ncbi:MAG: four helix bundle protein [Patescibacteria group bacterium]